MHSYKRRSDIYAGISLYDITHEKVRKSVLDEILEEAGGDIETIKKLATERIDELVPKHIIVDDIFASVNYVNCLTKRVGNVDDIDLLGNRRIGVIKRIKRI